MEPQAWGHTAEGEQVSEDLSIFTAAPHCSCYCLSSSSCQILHYGKLNSYFITFHNVITREIKCTINLLCLKNPGNNSPYAWKNWKNLPLNASHLPKWLGTTGLGNSYQDFKDVWSWRPPRHYSGKDGGEGILFPLQKERNGSVWERHTMSWKQEKFSVADTKSGCPEGITGHFGVK